MKSSEEKPLKSSVIKGLARAKTNLFLGVGDKWPESNLHRLETCYIRLAIFDEIEIEIRHSEKLIISTQVVLGESLSSHLKLQNINLDDYVSSITNEKNDAQKAVKKLFQKLNITGQVSIIIKKNLPSEAGLGGGSADAACVLRLLQTEYGISDSDIIEVAKEVGSDVYPCLYEQLSFSMMDSDKVYLSIPSANLSIKNRPVLVVKPPVGSSTSHAYSMLGRLKNEFSPKYEKRSIHSLASFKKLWGLDYPNAITELIKESGKYGCRHEEVKNNFYNDFEDVIFSQVPALRTAKCFFAEQGAFVSFLSGSGSSLIAIFEENQNLDEIENEFISTFGINWWSVQTRLHYSD